MNLRKIWQKAKDIYGYDESVLFYHKDKREYHRHKIAYCKKKLAESKTEQEAFKWNVRLEDEQRQYDISDHYIRNNSDEQTEPGWRNE